MNRSKSFMALLALLILVAIVMWISGAALPERMASHFTAAGRVDGTMPRRSYLTLMVALEVGVPLLIVILQLPMLLMHPRRIRLPDRDYWLAPERLEATRSWLWRHGLWFAALLAMFLGFTHWVVVRANELQPPRWPKSIFDWGAAVFALAVIVWFANFLMHFRRRRSV